jgi:predicted Zn finger-like uncharacterized protein
MNLAARCPACGTVFRVVQDQLKVSDGWVRCGRCAEVFNAIETLVDLEVDDTDRAAARSHGRERVMEDLARVAGSAPAELPDGQIRRADSRAADEAVAAPVEPSATTADEPAAPAVAGLGREHRPPAPGLRAERQEAPTFVRRAERAARWQRPAVRASLAVAAAFAGLGLVAQVAVEYRDLAAARWPSIRPALEQACALVGCWIESPRSIEALSVESSGLVRIDGTAMYRLSLVLRNRSPLALALPALDLTLTDSRGGIIARRVIGLEVLGAHTSSVPALAELALQTTLSATDRTISGYTIELFYP